MTEYSQITVVEGKKQVGYFCGRWQMFDSRHPFYKVNEDGNAESVVTKPEVQGIISLPREMDADEIREWIANDGADQFAEYVDDMDEWLEEKKTLDELLGSDAWASV